MRTAAVAKGSPPAPTCRLTIRLVGCQPPVWRRIEVPHDARLDWLHGVLQIATGWTNSHLHQFRLGGFFYSNPRHHYAEFVGDPEILDERGFTLDQLAPRKLDVVHYEYDFGDSWEHLLTVEDLRYSSAVAARVAVCVDGEGACPPEDCGGCYGYAELKDALRNRRHPEHRRLKTWVGPDFDPDRFDRDEINRCLAQLKWPGLTDAQLGKLLKARDR